ncbi:HAD family hydrolase, partial [Enterobacter quasiroggenkampii]|nr:HAD family hydrolase [Enterobacter quasiroggenkampii]
LGSMTVICSDKTGTLTKNEMTVMDVVTEEMTIVKEIMANCQELKLQDQQKIADLQGNPTELALLQYVDQDQLSLRPVEKKIPFSSSYKYMATRHPQAEGSIIYVKGAPEVLLQLSTLSDNQKGAWQAQAAQLAQKGQRVLG